MKTELYLKAYQLTTNAILSETAYENIFNVYLDGDFSAYNILKTVSIPEDLDTDIFYYTRTIGSLPWTQVSFDHYGTINLWWLICVTNKVMNPVVLPEPGLVLKIIKKQYIPDILDDIKALS